MRFATGPQCGLGLTWVVRCVVDSQTTVAVSLHSPLGVKCRAGDGAPVSKMQRNDAVAQPRHKRDSAARLFVRQLTSPTAARRAAPVVALATTAVVGVGVLLTEPEPTPAAAVDPAASAPSRLVDSTNVAERELVVSRSQAREALEERQEARADARREKREEDRREAMMATAQAVAGADTRLWATSNLNIWPDSREQTERLGLVDAGDKVLVTGRKADGRVEVVLDGKSRWVTAGYLSDEKPVGAATPGTGGTCTNGTSVAGGVSGNIVNVHRTVCARFPRSPSTARSGAAAATTRWAAPSTSWSAAPAAGRSRSTSAPTPAPSASPT